VVSLEHSDSRTHVLVAWVARRGVSRASLDVKWPDALAGRIWAVDHSVGSGYDSIAMARPHPIPIGGCPAGGAEESGVAHIVADALGNTALQWARGAARVVDLTWSVGY
jgi:hypothetical protein